jgi:hypothetical protein
MSPPIRVLTWALLALPVAFLAGASLGSPALAVPAVLVAGVYGWVWLRFRPTGFEVHPDAIEVIWPWKRRRIRRADVSDVRLIDRDELRREVGWCMRVGAGGLWGGFGWLWTQRRGIVQMYVSRTDRLVWIERAGGRPWLITPERPEAFVRAASEP